MRKRVIALDEGRLMRDERRGGYSEIPRRGWRALRSLGASMSTKWSPRH